MKSEDQTPFMKNILKRGSICVGIPGKQTEHNIGINH